MKNLFRTALFVALATFSFFSQAQTTSVTDGDWNDVATWGGSIPGAGADVVIASGTTVDINADVDVASLTVESGAVLQSASSGTFTLNISGDIVVQGTVDLTGTGVVNTFLDNTSTTVFTGSGSTTFNDLTANMGNVVVSDVFIVEGNFLLDNGIEFTANNEDLRFRGGYTLTGGASFITSNSITYFDGDADQAIDLTGGTASFSYVYFDNYAGGDIRTKTIDGDLTVQSGTLLRIFDDAILADTPGNSHSLYSLQLDHQDGFDIAGSTVTFLGGGSIRYSDGATDGIVDLGAGAGGSAGDVDLVFEGTTYLQDGDEIVVDGDVTIESAGQLVLNGSASTGATLTDHDNSHTLLVESNGDIYVRGDDNFPTSFGTYSFGTNSIVRYDQAYAQTIRGEKFDGTSIQFSRVLLNDGNADITKTLASGEDLLMGDRFDLQNSVDFVATHAAIIEVGEDITTDVSSGETPTFNAPSSTLRVNGTVSIQRLEELESGTGYVVGAMEITNPANGNKTVNISADVDLTGSGMSSTRTFSVENNGGSVSNILTVDLAENQVLGNSSIAFTDQFELLSNTILITTGSQFAVDFDDTNDTNTIDLESTVRFDGDNPQGIPEIDDANYGSIEFSGNGNKYILSEELNVDGSIRRTGGNFLFVLDQDFNPTTEAVSPEAKTITVNGDWSLRQQNVSTTDGDGETTVVQFNGTETQTILDSYFEDIIFSNTGTKNITENQVVSGDWYINDATVNLSASVDLEGSWVETAGAVFTATAGTVLFQGATFQLISANENSSFYNIEVDNNSTLLFSQVNGDHVDVDRDLTVQSGSTLTMQDLSVRIGRNLVLRNGSTLNYTDASAAIIFDGDEAQNFDNEIGGDGGAAEDVGGQTFPTFRFEGVGDKDCYDQEFTIEGDFVVASESAVNFGNTDIYFRGANWTVDGSFSHSRTVTFDGGATTTVSAATFNNAIVGDGSAATNVTLDGNVSINNQLTIESNSTLDVSPSNHNLQVEGNFNNYGTFVPREGKVTFVGGSAYFRTGSSGSDTDKHFWDLTISVDDGAYVRFDEADLLNDLVIVQNDFNVESGILQMRDDGANVQTLRVGGDLIFDGGQLSHETGSDRYLIELNASTADVNTIDLGGNLVRDFIIADTNPAHEYVLANTFETIDNANYHFELNGLGTVDLEGQIMIVNRGGVSMTSGTLEVDAGASLVIDGQGAGPNFLKSGGDIDLIGESANPATLTAVDINGFEFTQSGGDFEANNYIIANTNGAGLTMSGGTLTNFDNGLFTNGQGNAYMTLSNGVNFGSITANGVIFNSGPTFNVDANSGTTPDASSSITFVIAGGSLAGEAFENDSPDGGAEDGFILWDNDPGFTWNGSVSTEWDDPDNWTVDASLPETQGVDFPDDGDDIVYITDQSNDPRIDVTEGTINIGRLTINGGALTLDGGNLDVDGNLTILDDPSASIVFTAGETLTIEGSLSNAGDIVQTATGTITFDGTGGSHSITSDDVFTNLLINADASAVYGLGSGLIISDDFSLLGGTFDASSGFSLEVQGDFTVSGGTFSAGTGTVDFNGGTLANQNISGGTLNNANFSGASTKTFIGNVSIGGDFTIESGSADVILDNGGAIQLFVGGDWDNNNSATAFVPNDGRVIFNGQGRQDLGGSANTTFYDVSFQGSNSKYINNPLTVNRNLSILSPTVDLQSGGSITGTGSGIFTMSGGLLNVRASNFPTGFGTVSLLNGTVQYISDAANQDVVGGITYNNLTLRAVNGASTVSKTLQSTITVNGRLTLNTGIVTLIVGDNSLAINGDNFSNSYHLILDANDDITFGTDGEFIHNGSTYWVSDADLADVTFNDVTLSGGSTKDIRSNMIVNGTISVSSGTTLDQNTYTITGAGASDNLFILGATSTYINNSANSLPVGFFGYSLAESSTTTLNASIAQTLSTLNGSVGGSVTYGNLNIYSDNVVIFGSEDLDVDGDFDMNSDVTSLDDNGNDLYLSGATIDIINYVPTAGTTVYFDGDDQTITDNEGGSDDDLEFAHVVFGGTGTKTIYPNSGTEVMDVSESVIINSGVTLAMNNRAIEFSGTSFVNNGILTVPNRELIFDGTAGISFDPGDNEIYALTLSMTSGQTLAITGSGLNIGNGDVTIADGLTLDFGATEDLTHYVESDFILTGTAALTFADGSTNITSLVFDGGNQLIPVINQDNSNVVGIPNIILSGTGSKDLTGDIIVNDVTLESTIGNFDMQNPSTTTTHEMEVRGNWDNQGAIYLDRNSRVTFNAADASTRTITSNGEIFPEVVITGVTAGNYELDGDMVVNGESTNDWDGDGEEDALTIASTGVLDLNGFSLTLGNNDTDRPDPELNTIEAGGELIVGPGSVLQFDTNDDGFDVLVDADYNEIGARFEVDGTLTLVGVSGNAAIIDRSAGGDQIDININSSGTIAAENYSISYLVDDGLEISGSIDPVNNLSNGTWSNLENGSGADPTRYLYINFDLVNDVIAIDNITFNYDATATIGEEYHVAINDAVQSGSGYIEFTNVSGSLSNPAYDYEDDPTDPDGAPQGLGAAADTDGLLRWEALTQTLWVGSISNDWFTSGNWSAGLPSETLEAVIPAGSPYPAVLDLNEQDVLVSSGADLTILAITIEDGVLRILDSDGSSINTLIVSNDFIIGSGQSGTLITESSVDSIRVAGSLEINNNASYDDGGVSFTLNSVAPASPTVRSSNEAFGGLIIDSNSDYQFAGGTLDINGDFIVQTGSAPSINFQTNNYEFYIGGDVIDLDGNATLETSTNGVTILDGSDQSVTNFAFDQLTVASSGTATLDNATANDVFTINEGSIALGQGAITWEGDVIIYGEFQGAAGVTYTFNGDDWRAEAGSYNNELGLVRFNRSNGTQYIRQLDASPVEFNDVELASDATIYLGRFVSQNQEAGNVNVYGDFNVTSNVNGFLIDEYLVDAVGAGTQTFTLGENKRIDVYGYDNFPRGFTLYNMASTSNVRYLSSDDQIIRGGLAYGQLELRNQTTKTLDNYVDVQADLFITEATLDVSSNHYSVRVGGRWDSESGTVDGSFLARSGTITFNGDDDQVISLGNTGTQTFNNVVVDKSAGSVNVQSNISIDQDLTISDGEFDVNTFTIDLGGSLEISGTGDIISNAGGLINFIASFGSPTIRFNGSEFSGNIDIDAAGITYTMLDDVTVDNTTTITAGTLSLNGSTLNVGLSEDILNVYGTLNVSTAASPGGTLALSNQTQLVVQPGGAISLVGTPADVATVTRRSTGTFGFRVTGETANPGTIAARNYVIEYVNATGVYVTEDADIDDTDNFSEGSFANGVSGGTYLRIETEDEFTLMGGNAIENVVFNDNPGGGASNVSKTTGTSGTLEFSGYTGEFSGELFDNDPSDLIVWLDPDEVVWTGTYSRDWFTPGNWNTGVVPDGTKDVVIPSEPTQATLNQPRIDDTGDAVANNIRIEAGNSLTVASSDASGADLDAAGSITVQSTAALACEGTSDELEIGGSLLFESIPSFEAGTGSTFTFDSPTGAVTANSPAPFHNLIVNVTGTLNLLANTTVNGDFTIASSAAGSFGQNGFNFIVKGDFLNESSNADAYLPSTGTLQLEGSGTTVFSPGNVEYYNVSLGDGVTSVEYDITNNDLSLSNGLVVEDNATLDLNGFDVSVGDESSDQEVVEIFGAMDVAAGERLELGSGVNVTVSGSFSLIGSTGTPAMLTRKGSLGSYEFTVAPTGTFGAEDYEIRYIGGDGLTLEAGSTLALSTASGTIDVDEDTFNDDFLALRNGVFSNGAGEAYISLENNFGGNTIKADNITFNDGPSFNVSRVGSLDDIIFVDPSGSLQGSNFEQDDEYPAQSATTGNVQWYYTDPLIVWEGDDATFPNDWNVPGNWDTGVVPTNANTVQIPDVTNQPIIYDDGLASGANTDGVAASIIILSGASLDIQGDRTLTIDEDLSNAGTLNLDGNLVVSGEFSNTGVMVPGPISVVTLNTTGDVFFNGGSAFNDLTFNASAPTDIISTSGGLEIGGDFTLNQGVFTVADASHNLTVGGNFTVGVNADFNAGEGSVFLNGDADQVIDDLAGTTFVFSDLTVSGGTSSTRTKTFSDDLVVTGDLAVEDLFTVLDLNNSTTTINGNLRVDDNAEIEANTGLVVFANSSSQTISGSGGTGGITFYQLEVDNSNVSTSDLILGIDVTVENELIFTDGTIAAQSGSLIFDKGATHTGSDDSKYITGFAVKNTSDDEVFTFPIGVGTRAANIGISGNTEEDDAYTANYTFGSPTDRASVDGSVVRISGLEYWDLSRTGTGTPLVSLHFDETSEVNDLLALTVAHYTGGVWEDEGNGGTTGTTTDGVITSANSFSSFSPVTLGTTDDSVNPLPVELLEFYGEAENGDVNLFWSTASELNNDYFEVQRSADGLEFETIGVVEGHGTTSEVSSYSLRDANPLLGINYYRLKQVDFDQAVEYHKVILVNNDTFGSRLDVTAYPNPTTQENLKIKIVSGDNHTPYEVTIIDIAGNTFYQSTFEGALVLDEQIVPFRVMTAGLYFVTVQQGATVIRSKIMIK